MKRHTSLIIYAVVILWLGTGCSGIRNGLSSFDVTKRHHRPGYYVELPFGPPDAGNDNSTCSKPINP